MKTTKISQHDAEAIMIALDQVSQTIDVMTIVIDRLKLRINASLHGKQSEQVHSDNAKATSHQTPALKSDAIH
jgi:hypothetical protein